VHQIENDWDVKTVSDVLVLAEQELLRISQDERYIIDMGTYHAPIAEYGPNDVVVQTRCRVCLAGCVLSGFIKPNEAYSPCDLDRELYRMIQALDDFREGDMPEFLKNLVCTKDWLKYMNYMSKPGVWDSKPSTEYFSGKLSKGEIQELAQQCREWAEWFVDHDLNFEVITEEL
jgi:hypothetical protein